MKQPYKRSWRLTAIYASPQEILRRLLWAELKILANRMDKEWTLIGDFNEISCPTKEKGGGRTNLKACQRFKDFMNEFSLIDLVYAGTRFMWRGLV